MFLKPFILISSSIKSTLWAISGLHEGISTIRFFLFFLQVKPNWVRIFCASLIDIGIPIKLSKLSNSNFMTLFFWKFLPVIVNLLAWPPHIFSISSVAISRPFLTELGSIPLSNLYFASVSIANSREVLLIDDGRK